jgi:hypothetical protein
MVVVDNRMMIESRDQNGYRTGRCQRRSISPSGRWVRRLYFGDVRGSAQVLQNDQPTLYFEPIICGNIGKSVSMS